MIRILNTYEITCDVCTTERKVFTASEPTLPSGWIQDQEHDCGMTGYSRTRHICPDCHHKASGHSSKGFGGNS